MNREMVPMKSLIKEITMGPFGSDLKVDNFIDEGVPVLNGSNLSGVKLSEESFKYVSKEKAKSLKKANTKRGDIVITHRGTLGQISYIPRSSKFDNYIISQSQFRITLKEELIDPIFFTYYFHTNEGQKRLLSFKSHVGVPALAQATTNFRLLEFPYIPLSNQLKIAKVLSDLDSKIELNNKINEELESMGKLIYDYWFVQFDFPISKEQAEAMGKPELEGKPYKASGGKMVYNEELKREIPEGWEVEEIENILEKRNWGKKIKSSDYKSSGAIPIIDQSINYICGYTEQKDAIIEGSTPKIIFGDHTRIVKFINFDFARGADGTQIISSKEKRVPQHYFYQTLLKFDLSNYGYARHFKFLKALKILIPDLNISKRFEDIVRSFYVKRRENIFENNQLSELRDWLLPMLMNGQVTVGVIEEEFEHNMAAEPKVDYG